LMSLIQKAIRDLFSDISFLQYKEHSEDPRIY
jgi:hypothetical protein